MTGVELNCPKCGGDIFCHQLAINDGILYLLSECPNCEVELRFSTERILAQLQGIHLSPEPKMRM